MGILKFFDDLFCAIEGSTNGTIAGVKPAEEEQTLGAIADFIFSLKSDKNQALDGVYLDNKEKFKTELLKELNGFATDLQWQKPWKPAYFVDTEKGRITTYRPMNIRGEAYIPINAVLLKPGFYITPKELTKRGGRVNNNTFPYYIGHFFYVEIEEEKTTVENGEKVSTIETRKVPRMRGSKVFNTEDVICDNVPRFRDLKKYHYEDNELNEFIENFITKLKDLKRIPKLFFDQVDKCFFIPSKDEIHLVDFRNFEKMDEYYSTLLHEVIHSTLLRKKDGKPVRNGFEDKYKLVSYACEELVAEMGAYILCSELGLSYTKQNSLAYLKNWEGFAKEIRDDILLEAYGQACQAVDFLVEDIDFKALIPNEIIKKVKAEAKKEKPKEKPKAEPKPKATEEKPKEKPKAEPKPKATEEKPKEEPKAEPKPKATEEKPKEEPKEEPKPKATEEKPKEKLKFEPTYYFIDEEQARIANELNSHISYKQGSATELYKENIDYVFDILNDIPEYNLQQALYLAKEYSRRYASWINEKNRIDSLYPSVLVCGPAKFNTKKKESQNSARKSHYALYDKIKHLVTRIYDLKKRMHAVRSDDESAIADLEFKLEILQTNHNKMIETNKYYRKHKTVKGCPYLNEKEIEKAEKIIEEYHDNSIFSTYQIGRLLADIKKVQNRIESIKRLKSINDKPKDEPTKQDDLTQKVERNYMSVEYNTNDMRIRLYFKGKPSEEVRNLLKSKAFKWSPRFACWQRLLTDNALKEFVWSMLPKLDNFYNYEAEPKAEPKPKATEEKPKEEPEPLIKYYPINEDLAEQYHNTITNAPYIKGTATNAYKEKINSIYKTANSAPDITRDMALKQARTYSQLYADYINKYNEIGCTIKNKEEQIKAFEALKTESKKIDSLEFIIEDLRHGRDKKEEPKSELDELVDKAKKDFEDLSKL